MIKDYYKILQISKTFSDQELRSRYRNLVKLWHPDVNDSEEAKSKIVEITEAYEILSDPFKRRTYDAMREQALTSVQQKPTTEESYATDKMNIWIREAKNNSSKINNNPLEVFETAFDAMVQAGKKAYSIFSIILYSTVALGLTWLCVLLIKSQFEDGKNEFADIFVTVFVLMFLLALFASVKMNISDKIRKK